MSGRFIFLPSEGPAEAAGCDEAQFGTHDGNYVV